MEDKKLNVVSIPPEAMTSVEFSGEFYQRLNKLMLEYADLKGSEKFIEAMYLIKRGNAHKNDYAFNVETLLILLKGIEEAFQKAGQTKDNEISLKDIADNQD